MGATQSAIIRDASDDEAENINADVDTGWFHLFDLFFSFINESVKEMSVLLLFR